MAVFPVLFALSAIKIYCADGTDNFEPSLNVRSAKFLHALFPNPVAAEHVPKRGFNLAIRVFFLAF